MNYVLMNFPWTHGYSENFLDQERANQMRSDFPEWDSQIWDTHGKFLNLSMDIKKN